MSVQKFIKLEKSVDWSIWIFFVRTRAQTANIWKFINFNFNAKFECLTKSVEPSYIEAAEFDAKTFEIYKTRSLVYTKALAKYEKQKTAFENIIEFIQQIISSTAAIIIHDVNAHSWNFFRVFKTRLISADNARHFEIKIKYHNLRNGSKNQNIKKWLNTWQLIYIEGRELRIEKTLKVRSIRNFIFAVMKKNHAWTITQLAQLRSLMLNETNFLTLVKDYRLYARMINIHKIHVFSHAIFSIDANEKRQTSSIRPNQNISAKGDKTSFKKQNQSFECLCGLFHWYNRCYYLNFKKRSANWSPNVEIQNKVTETLKNEKFKTKIEVFIKRSNDFEKEKRKNKDKNNKSNRTSQGVFGTGNSEIISYELNAENSSAFFVLIQSTVFSFYTYPLHSSWILNNGSDTHVCNRFMARRYRKTRDVLNEKMIADDTSKVIARSGFGQNINPTRP